MPQFVSQCLQRSDNTFAHSRRNDNRKQQDQQIDVDEHRQIGEQLARQRVRTIKHRHANIGQRVSVRIGHDGIRRQIFQIANRFGNDIVAVLDAEKYLRIEEFARQTSRKNVWSRSGHELSAGIVNMYIGAIEFRQILNEKTQLGIVGQVGCIAPEEGLHLRFDTAHLVAQ